MLQLEPHGELAQRLHPGHGQWFDPAPDRPRRPLLGTSQFFPPGRLKSCGTAKTPIEHATDRALRRIQISLDGINNIVGREQPAIRKPHARTQLELQDQAVGRSLRQGFSERRDELPVGGVVQQGIEDELGEHPFMSRHDLRRVERPLIALDGQSQRAAALGRLGSRHGGCGQQKEEENYYRSKRRKRRGGERSEAQTPPIPIPTGLRPPAQGCRACEATLGARRRRRINPNGVAASNGKK